MDAFFLSFGYLGLFAISFLAATLLPMASEVAFIAMPALGYNIWGVFLAGTTGSILGSVSNYIIGKKGGAYVLERYSGKQNRRLAQAVDLYQRWGPLIVFMAWVPVIGDPLTIVAGVFRLQFGRFIFWLTLGKTCKYLVLVALMHQVFPFDVLG